MKWPWYRTIPGDVIITGQRLDAPAPPMPTITLRGVHDGYNETGFHPSGLLFPSAGCWEVKAKVGEASLIFVTLVVKIPFDPVRPAWMPESLLIKDWDVVLPQSIREIFGSPIWADPLWRKGLIGWAEGEVIVETTQGLPEQRDPYPEAAQQQVTVSEQPGVCVQGAWDKQHHWQDEADAGALEWGADGFSYRISHNGLGLHCKELLRIVGSTP